MSASLVGSEMCIRDSPHPRPQDPCRRPGGCAWCSPGGGRAGNPGPCTSPCLLYTSDAADDM
eukprot:3416458-Alexandrium_andersonii.AAC.1